MVQDLTSAALITPSTTTMDSDYIRQKSSQVGRSLDGSDVRTDRDGLGKLEHLLRHLMFILFTRHDEYALESMCLLSEAEKDNLRPCDDHGQLFSSSARQDLTLGPDIM